MDSPKHERDRHRSSPRKEGANPLAKRVTELEKLLTVKDQAEPTPIDPKSPFIPDIDQARADPSRKMPPMDSYDGSGDPYDRTDGYNRIMNYYGHPDATKCHMFATTLKKGAREWMSTLSLRSIESWSDLRERFHAQFGSNKRRGKVTTSLMQIKQRSDESLSQYVKRFREAVGTVTELNSPQALGFFTTGLDMVKSKKLMKDIMFNPPKDLSEAYDRAEGFIAVEEAVGSLKPRSEHRDKPKERERNNIPRSDNNLNRSEDQQKKNYNNNNGGSGGGCSHYPNRDVNKIYTPLIKDRAKILEEL